MAGNKNNQLPEFQSLDELVDYFDHHDLGDYLEDMPAVDFEIDIQSRTHLVALDDELLDDLNEIARKRQIPSAKLINMWLKEKLAEQSVL